VRPVTAMLDSALLLWRDGDLGSEPMSILHLLPGAEQQPHLCYRESSSPEHNVRAYFARLDFETRYNTRALTGAVLCLVVCVCGPTRQAAVGRHEGNLVTAAEAVLAGWLAGRFLPILVGAERVRT